MNKIWFYLTILISVGLVGSIYIFKPGSSIGAEDSPIFTIQYIEEEKNDEQVKTSSIQNNQAQLEKHSESMQTLLETNDDLVQKKTCTGNWIRLEGQSLINLGYSTVADWNASSNPSIVTETRNNNNIVVIGHNKCEFGDCERPFTDFAEIINAKVGQTAEFCFENQYFYGNVILSEPVPETAMYVMEPNWQGKDVVTAFTCYGNCHDENCNSTDQRWVVSFVRK